MSGFHFQPRAVRARSARIPALALSLALAAVPSLADVPVPPLTARVTDLTGTLTPAQRDDIEQSLKAFEEKKGSQIAVLIVPTTRPEEIEQYGIRVAEKWKLGRKGIDDGVLLLIAKNDRKLRIEVGRGLEGALPDAVAKRIVAEIVTPRLKQGDFHGGIAAGVEQMIRVIEGEPLPAPRPQAARKGRNGDWSPFLLFIVVVGVGAAARAVFGRAVGAAATGAAAAFAGWLFFGVAIVAAILGVAAFLFALIQGGRGGGSGAGWSTGGWSSGGGGDFGGFSGGGGDFGGGGASGEW